MRRAQKFIVREWVKRQPKPDAKPSPPPIRWRRWGLIPAPWLRCAAAVTDNHL